MVNRTAVMKLCKNAALPPHPTGRHPIAAYCWTCKDAIDLRTDREHQRRKYRAGRLRALDREPEGRD